MQNYIIYGLGISGIAVAKYLIRANNKVIITDDNDSAIENARAKLAQDIFEHQENVQFLKSDAIENHCNFNSSIIFAPGIPLHYPRPHKILEIAKKTQAKLLCDIELFYLLNKNKNFLGITGTNGKSTTVALAGFILNYIKIDAKIGGNIGVPCFDLDDAANYVFEISSYHLDLMQQTHFKTAALTNITPDHIDRHGTFAKYIAAKKRIFNNQTKGDFAIIAIDNDHSKEVFDDLKNDDSFEAKLIPISTQKICADGVSVIDGVLYNKIDGALSELSLNGAVLRGEHNMQNIAVAFASIYCAFYKKFAAGSSAGAHDLEKKIIEAIKNFAGLRHRMQFLGQVDGVSFINDSKATNAESTENALKSYDHIFWILGGKPKEGGIDILQPYFSKITKAYLIGEATEEFAKVLQKNNVEFEKCIDLKNAFYRSFADAKKSSLKEKNILLSPACASFDQWKNFEERGDYFCKEFDEINKN